MSDKPDVIAVVENDGSIQVNYAAVHATVVVDEGTGIVYAEEFGDILEIPTVYEAFIMDLWADVYSEEEYTKEFGRETFWRVIHEYCRQRRNVDVRAGDFGS
jgi:hypothetical protein